MGRQTGGAHRLVLPTQWRGGTCACSQPRPTRTCQGATPRLVHPHHLGVPLLPQLYLHRARGAARCGSAASRLVGGRWRGRCTGCATPAAKRACACCCCPCWWERLLHLWRGERGHSILCCLLGAPALALGRLGCVARASHRSHRRRRCASPPRNRLELPQRPSGAAAQRQRRCGVHGAGLQRAREGGRGAGDETPPHRACSRLRASPDPAYTLQLVKCLVQRGGAAACLAASARLVWGAGGHLLVPSSPLACSILAAGATAVSPGRWGLQLARQAARRRGGRWALGLKASK